MSLVRNFSYLSRLWKFWNDKVISLHRIYSSEYWTYSLKTLFSLIPCLYTIQLFAYQLVDNLKTKIFLFITLSKHRYGSEKKLIYFKKTEKVLRSNQIFNQNVSFEYVYCCAYLNYDRFVVVFWTFSIFTFEEHYHILRMRKGYYFVAHEKNGHYKRVTNTWES